MAISRDIQNHLAKGDYAALEGEWLTSLEEDPTDLDYFVGVARALVGNGQEGRARDLLEMLDEQLREGGHWAARLKLLKRAGPLLLPPDKTHPTIVSTLNKLYGDRGTFKGLFEAVGLHRAPQDIPKTWEQVARLETLLSSDVPTAVAMEGNAVGRAAAANPRPDTFKLAFPRHTR